MVNESIYHKLADIKLEELFEYAENLDGDELLEVDLSMGVLNIANDAGKEFVINKHTPTRQIWVSSPYSGASYFAYDDAKQGWYHTRNKQAGAEIAQELSQELAKFAKVSNA